MDGAPAIDPPQTPARINPMTSKPIERIAGRGEAIAYHDCGC